MPLRRAPAPPHAHCAAPPAPGQEERPPVTPRPHAAHAHSPARPSPRNQPPSLPPSPHPTPPHRPRREYADFRVSSDGELQGVGLLIASDPSSGRLVVLAPIKGSPAERAGIQPGDEVRAARGAAGACVGGVGWGLGGRGGGSAPKRVGCAQKTSSGPLKYSACQYSVRKRLPTCSRCSGSGAPGFHARRPGPWAPLGQSPHAWPPGGRSRGAGTLNTRSGLEALCPEYREGLHFSGLESWCRKQ